MKKTTQQNKQSFTRPAMLLCGIFVAILSGRAGFGQQAAKSVPAPKQIASVASSPATTVVAPQVEEGQEAKAPKKQGGEGIKVHGHWEITVKNADGSVAEHRDFENSLTTSTTAGPLNPYGFGSELLAMLLSGNAEPGLPGLALVQTLPADPTLACFGPTTNCTILVMPNTLLTPIGLGGFLNYQFTTQTGLTAVATFTPTASLALGGAFQQSAAGPTTYTAVQAIFPVCISYQESESPGTAFGNGNFGPNQCNPGGLSAINSNGILLTYNEAYSDVPVTSTLITQGGTAAPLTLQPSQTISISFTLTFS